MEAVCIMLSVKAERKPEPGTGKMVEDFWGPSVKLLGDMKFLDRLKTYDKDSIPAEIMKKIRQKLVHCQKLVSLFEFGRHI
jgi:dynein heavy chain, axonemal